MMTVRVKLRIIALFLGFTSLATAQYTSYDWKERDQWMKIDDFFELVKVPTESTVADIGCHEGYLTMHLAERVGEKGRVYAVDVNDYRLTKLEKHAKRLKHSNIITIEGDYDDPKLPQNSLDYIFVIDSYHEMTEYKEMLRHFYRSLKPGGTIVMLEKIKRYKIGKSRSEQTAAHTLSLKYVKTDLQTAGFKLGQEVPNFGYWERDKTKKMWILTAQKP